MPIISPGRAAKMPARFSNPFLLSYRCSENRLESEAMNLASLCGFLIEIFQNIFWLSIAVIPCQVDRIRVTVATKPVLAFGAFMLA
jgi:hypothetical protein